MEISKRQLIIAGSVLGLILLVVVFNALKNKSYQSGSTSTNTTASQSQSQTTILISPQVNSNFYKNAADKTTYQAFPMIIGGKNISSIKLERLTGQVPAGLSAMPLYSYEFYKSDKKYNPQQTLSAKIVERSLVIYSNPEESVKISVPITESVRVANFSWITDGLILLVEKGTSGNNFFLVETDSGKKTFLTDDSLIPDKTDIGIGMKAFNSARQSLIVLTSTQGDYWQLILNQQ